jgi:phage FluMu protein Com
MGMFDSVYIKCPHCKHENEHQTKAGACTLENYTLGTVPKT